MSEKKSIVGKDTQPREAPKDLAAAAGKVDKDADARIASVDSPPRTGPSPPAIRGLGADHRRQGRQQLLVGEVHQGLRQDRILADVQGSLMSGSDSNRGQQEGSPLAPVHTAPRAVQEDRGRRVQRLQGDRAHSVQGFSPGRGASRRSPRRRAACSAGSSAAIASPS